MPSYHDALASVTEAYCLTDAKTGKLYIGSATGEGGVAARWEIYLDSKHGDNKKLSELYERKGEGYFLENFGFTLLEYFGISYDPQKVQEREKWWKNCLDTRAADTTAIKKASLSSDNRPAYCKAIRNDTISSVDESQTSNARQPWQLNSMGD